MAGNMICPSGSLRFVSALLEHFAHAHTHLSNIEQQIKFHIDVLRAVPMGDTSCGSLLAAASR